jgi:fatty-acyl-CoA synthase
MAERDGWRPDLDAHAPSSNHGYGMQGESAMSRAGPAPAGENPFEAGLERNPANYVPLTPLSFLARAARVYPARLAYVHGEVRVDYATFYARCVRLASALVRRGVGLGDTVAVMAPNVPALLEAHYGVPMAGAVLNALNVRLDAATIAYILGHGEAKVVLVDREFSATVAEALARLRVRPAVIDIDDPLYGGAGERLGTLEYEALLAEGAPIQYVQALAGHASVTMTEHYYAYVDEHQERLREYLPHVARA